MQPAHDAPACALRGLAPGAVSACVGWRQRASEMDDWELRRSSRAKKPLLNYKEQSDDEEEHDYTIAWRRLSQALRAADAPGQPDVVQSRCGADHGLGDEAAMAHGPRERSAHGLISPWRLPSPRSAGISASSSCSGMAFDARCCCCRRPPRSRPAWRSACAYPTTSPCTTSPSTSPRCDAGRLHAHGRPGSLDWAPAWTGGAGAVSTNRPCASLAS
jgi:hypothetical protein